MPATVDFIFDFGSPNAYLAYQVLPGMLQTSGAQLNIIPCLLGGIFKATGNQSPMEAFSNVRGKLEYARLEMQRFIKKHQLSRFQMNPHFPVNTLTLMRGAIVAQQDDRLADYVDAGLKHMWEDGLKMDDPQVYVQAMNAAGFDGQGLLERTQNADVKQQLITNTNDAVARGVFGIPTFFVGDEMFFGKDRLELVVEAASV